MNTSELHKLRSEFVEALYQSAGCPIMLCTSLECCAPMAKLMFMVGLDYTLDVTDFGSVFKHKNSTVATRSEVEALQTMGMIVHTGNICTKQIWAGFSEVPQSVGELLSANESFWSERIRTMERQPMSNASRQIIAKEFLYALSEISLTDNYLSNFRS